MIEQKIITAIGETIGREREKRGMTQQDLAKKCCIAKSTIARIETGEGTPSLTIACILLNALGYELTIQKKEDI